MSSKLIVVYITDTTYRTILSTAAKTANATTTSITYNGIPQV